MHVAAKPDPYSPLQINKTQHNERERGVGLAGQTIAANFALVHSLLINMFQHCCHALEIAVNCKCGWSRRQAALSQPWLSYRTKLGCKKLMSSLTPHCINFKHAIISYQLVDWSKKVGEIVHSNPAGEQRWVILGQLMHVLQYSNGILQPWNCVHRPKNSLFEDGMEKFEGSLTLV